MGGSNWVPGDIFRGEERALRLVIGNDVEVEGSVPEASLLWPLTDI